MMAVPTPSPLDHPFADRAHRLYVALTNHCNRACPWCSTCSSPAGSTWLSMERYRASFPKDGPFQVQLEGGEPTLHPDFFEFVRVAREEPRCERLILCTNGVVLPRANGRLRDWLLRLGEPLTLKISVNHHLLERDATLLPLVASIRDAFTALGGERLLVVNVRLRRGHEDDDRAVLEAVENAALLPHANVFFLQRYGFASDETGWDPPAPVSSNFTLVNPDGALFGPDLVSRSESMRGLP